MARYIPPSIESYGGITPFLDATADKHNGMDASIIKRHWNWGKYPHVSILALAREAGVVWETMSGWLHKLHEEVGIEWPTEVRK